MDTDYKWLFKKNIEIGEHEEAGDKPFFEELLAPAFAFLRRDGNVVSRQQFLDAVKEGDPRKTTVLTITFLGSNRALVTALVEMGDERFHNLRLFVRKSGSKWKLLAWANEEIRPAPP